MNADLGSLSPKQAMYAVLGSGVGANVVRTVTLQFLGEAPDASGCFWMELVIEKVGGKRLIVRVLLDDPLLAAEHKSQATVHRYIYKESDAPAVEYVDGVTGRAVTTTFGLLENFFPTFDEAAAQRELFPNRGRFLGLPIARAEASNDPRALLSGADIRLELNPWLLIGTGRNAREVEGRRIWTGEEYTYRRFEQADYDEMIEAGINYFRADEDQRSWICHRPVFYTLIRVNHQTPYPEIFYRANCRGTRMFIDEPAVHQAWFFGANPDLAKSLSHPREAARLLEHRVRETYNSQGVYGRWSLMQSLQMVSYDLGELQIDETHFPIWETIYPTAYYQMKAGPTGFVHESRYVLGHDPQIFNAQFGVRIPCEPASIFKIHNAYFRGAARAFDGDWGIAIYGQAEQEISPLAVTTAYDMGARYLWYWTSDRLHHLPYDEQRVIHKHAAEHPRGPLTDLKRRAPVAIVLPDGYTLQPHRLWQTNAFHLDRCNEHGLTYREVLAKAGEQIERCIKQNVEFDLLYDDEMLEAGGYEQAVFVRENGSVDGVRGSESITVPAPPRDEPAPSPPTLSIMAEPTSGPAPLTVKLRAVAKAADGPVGTKDRRLPDGSWAYRQVYWSVFEDPELPQQYYSPEAEHTFQNPGRYRVTAWTCNDQGGPAEKSLEIVVN